MRVKWLFEYIHINIPAPFRSTSKIYSQTTAQLASQDQLMVTKMGVKLVVSSYFLDDYFHDIF